jgi:hypothetical protein
MKQFILFVMSCGILLSCSEEEILTSTTPNPGTCIVSGKVKANLNSANDTILAGQINYENANNINITFVVNSEDLEIHPDDNFEYEMLSFTTQVINGEYNVELPAISRPYNVDVILEEFNYNQQFLYYDANLDSSYVTTTEKLFYSPQASVNNIVKNNNKTQNFTYITQ